MNLSEFNVHHNNFVSALIEKMPEIEKTINALFEIKRQRKLKGLNMTPKTQISEPVTPTELNVSEGAESIQELDWENTHTEQSIGNAPF